MAYKPTWSEFWDWYSTCKEADQLEMKESLDRIISESSPKVKEEILKDAPKEFKGYDVDRYWDLNEKPEAIKTLAPEELDKERQAILNRIYNGKPPKIASVAEMRKAKRSGQDNRWTMRRIAYYFARGFFRGR